jgi:hypothetical protein|tara:strand:- start:1 stop:447 length:447 start_codon:yes stop_codon:yes gene_type:complete
MSGKKHGLQDKYKKLRMGGMMYYSKGALSEKQKAIAAKAPPYNEIGGNDFAKMREEKKPVKAFMGLAVEAFKKGKEKGAKGPELVSPLLMAKKLFNKKGGGVIKANKGLHAEKKKDKKDENDMSKLPKGLRKDTTTGFGKNIKKIKDE